MMYLAGVDPAAAGYDITVMRCGGCGNEIDPAMCCCGSPVKDHGWGDGHGPVPMGCTCYYGGSNE